MPSPAPEGAASAAPRVNLDSLPPADPFSLLPESMRSARRWLVWKAEPNGDKKPRKVPHYANSKKRTKTDTPEDLEQLADFETARKALERGRYTGLGFALGPDEDGNHWQGIDLDGTDQRKELADLVDLLPGYVERSPSGKGWHAIGIGRDFESLGSNASGIEAYSHGRYFTVTGMDGDSDLEDLADFVVETLRPMHSPRAKDKDARVDRQHIDTSDQLVRDLRSALAFMRSDDRDTWIRMGLALKTLDDQGRALWIEWSQTSAKYDPQDAARVWDSFKPESTHYREVFAEAQRAGWTNPAKRANVGEGKSQTYLSSDTFDPFATRDSDLRDTFGKPSEDGSIPSDFYGKLTFTTNEGDTKRLIDSHAADAVAAHLRHKVAWDTEAAAWLVWTGTHWEPQIISAAAEKALADAVDEGTKPIGFRLAYLNGVTQIICRRGLLPPPEWPHSVIPFKNGLLDIETGKLEKPTPTRALDWCLPWEYDPRAHCPTIKAWLLRAVDRDEATVELLRAWLAALIRGIALQYFLTLIGRGGSGKGTFQRLVTALVGLLNVAVTDLARLESRPFETALLYGKRLAMVNEAGKYGGSLNVLKAITGGDHIPLERKHVQRSGSFVFGGLVLMATNEPIVSTDSTSGLERRRITVRFPTSATPEEKADWRARGGEEAVLHAEIPGLVNWLLELSVEDIERTLAHPPEKVAAENLLGMAAGNSVADWMLDNCIPVEHDTQGAQIGRKSDSTIRLYPNYLEWCKESGRDYPVAMKKFSTIVLDIGQTLGCQLEKKNHPETRAACIYGLRLRSADDESHDWSRRYRRSVPKVSEGQEEGMEPASRRYRRDEGQNFSSNLSDRASAERYLDSIGETDPAARREYIEAQLGRDAA